MVFEKILRGQVSEFSINDGKGKAVCKGFASVYVAYLLTDDMKAIIGEGNSYVYFYSFGTLIEYRHKGFGRELLTYVCNKYKNADIVLHASSVGEMTQEQLIEFYKSCGFEHINDGSPYYCMIKRKTM